MYLTVKQQVKHLSKEDYRSIKELCHIAKNLTNQAIYNIRQHYFAEGKYLNYEKNYALLKSSDNYRTLNSNMAQQILKEVDGGSLTVVSNFLLTKSLKTLIISMLLSFFIVKFVKINVLIWANVRYNRHRR